MAVKKTTKKVVKKVVKKATKKVAKYDRHSHVTCDHKLKFCKHCDTAYCGKCNAEWKKQSYSWTSSGTNQYLCGTQGTTARGGLDLHTGPATGSTGGSNIATTNPSGINTSGSVNHSKHNK